jgi:hypothetical protein
MKSQRKNYSRKNKRTKKNVKRNSRSRKMRGGLIENPNDIIKQIESINDSNATFSAINKNFANINNIPEKIGEAIKIKQNITNVVINNCFLTNDGAKSLFTKLQGSNVTSIDLQNNQLKEDELFLTFLEDTINNYTKLKSLNVYGNPIATNDRMQKILAIVNARKTQN